MVYISGPVTGTTDYKERFEKAALDAKALIGKEVINPITVTSAIPDGSPWLDYMKLAIPALLLCDAIYMMKGWEHSKGARIEHGLAEGGGFDVYYEE
ncbi:MAG: DUF4406 domain-containing protein [Lachnospiraceae bacterium]|nr:DUF4406 domain-containing protein [Clostridia bacterium]MBR1691214.1 DUF4406 domain-containing protein [Lachnospiraceae bacterium]